MRLYDSLTQALILILQLSLPVIIAATAVGLVIGLVQALTQIQDQTLPHALKLLAVAGVIIILGGGLAAQLVAFAEDVFSRIATG
ncbi:type III secretion system export apparatus subunit SctS [Paracoccus sediminicola]|uniref:type III secretion system export apparatus subunit SctS n=1 Tax=Paracoccus sediminicola TaxID=3017783 RepID=UPI0022F01A56|nr:type III secretion system export apparatus subunit SctS [Paracoccus sediminicola]WBU57187.1 type III secretion system export apparatus subunit SctS [Paracoccus sediminicola]